MKRMKVTTLQSQGWTVKFFEGKKQVAAIYGSALTRIGYVLRSILADMKDHAGIPLQTKDMLRIGNEVTFEGYEQEQIWNKLVLIAKLQSRVTSLTRVEIIALRVKRFSYEEATYWLSRITDYGEPMNTWALKGLRLMLAGSPNDPERYEVLERLKSRA